MQNCGIFMGKFVFCNIYLICHKAIKMYLADLSRKSTLVSNLDMKVVECHRPTFKVVYLSEHLPLSSKWQCHVYDWLIVPNGNRRLLDFNMAYIYVLIIIEISFWLLIRSRENYIIGTVVQVHDFHLMKVLFLSFVPKQKRKKLGPKSQSSR